MDEKLKELLENVQRTAADVGDSAVDAADRMGKKASSLLSAGKLNVRIMELEGQVNTALQEVGKLIYATHTGSPSDSEVLLQKLQDIDGLKARIAELKGEPAQARGAAVCPACGAQARKGDVFCRSCGAKL